MDAQDQELDSWHKAVEKVIDKEVKALLQSNSRTREIDANCLQKYRQTKKKDKNFKKNKSADIFPADIPSRNQSSSSNQSQTNKIDQNHQEDS